MMMRAMRTRINPHEQDKNNSSYCHKTEPIMGLGAQSAPRESSFALAQASGALELVP